MHYELKIEHVVMRIVLCTRTSNREDECKTSPQKRINKQSYTFKNK